MKQKIEPIVHNEKQNGTIRGKPQEWAHRGHFIEVVVFKKRCDALCVHGLLISFCRFRYTQSIANGPTLLVV